MAIFSFALNSFEIMQTRSLHQDTDFVTFSIVVNPQGGVGNPQTLKKSMGNVNNGGFHLGMSFPNVVVNPTDTVLMNYLILNSGHKNPGEVETALENAATKMLMEGADLLSMYLSGLGVPDTTAVLDAVAKYISDEIIAVLNANCDGCVAGGQYSFTYDELIAKLAPGPFQQNLKFLGGASPKGCGSNSVYYVDWQMMEIGNAANRTVPNLYEMPLSKAQQLVQATGLVPKFTGPSGPKSWVQSQTPVAGQVVDAGSTVSMTLSVSALP
jgi:hypothetical protein